MYLKKTEFCEGFSVLTKRQDKNNYAQVNNVIMMLEISRENHCKKYAHFPCNHLAVINKLIQLVNPINEYIRKCIGRAQRY